MFEVEFGFVRIVPSERAATERVAAVYRPASVKAHAAVALQESLVCAMD